MIKSRHQSRSFSSNIIEKIESMSYQRLKILIQFLSTFMYQDFEPLIGHYFLFLFSVLFPFSFSLLLSSSIIGTCIPRSYILPSTTIVIGDAEGGGQGGPWPPPPVFGRSDNPISARGDYAHFITTDPPIFVRCRVSGD